MTAAAPRLLIAARRARHKAGLAALATLVLAGCGGAARPAAAPPVAAPPASGAYRWLVPTTGAPPSIAQENREPGTTAWRLPGPRILIGGEGRGAIEGYVAREALAPGELQRIYVSAPRARSVRIRVYRMGWYGGRGGRLMLESGALPAHAQPPCHHTATTGLTECRWHPTLSFTVPPALPSGVYIAKMTAGAAARDAIFVVRAAHPGTLVAELPSATWEAYNAWGGDSLYPGGSRRVASTGTTQGVAVSYDRPYDSQTGAGQFFIREVAAVRFLERYAYPVAYTTIASIDADPAQLRGARALLDLGHSEYWSQRDRDAFAAARDGATSLLFLSSDKIAWRVRFAPASPASSEAGAAGHVIIAYKEHAALDPGTPRTGLFPDGGAALSGSAYDGCITPRLSLPGPPVYRYYPWRPAPGLRPSWLYAGSGVTAATAIPGITGYELDRRTPLTPPGTQLIGGGGPVPCQPNAEPAAASGSVADTTLHTAPSGALVFATGTLGWLYGLEPVPQASPDVPRAPDPRVVAITRNVLARALGG